MPENPLLPNRKLQRLYSDMLRCRDRAKGLEAIFATLAEQLEAGDAVLTGTAADALSSLLTPLKRGSGIARLFTPPASELAYACGMAAGAQVAAKSRLVAAVLSMRQAPDWPQWLATAQRERLPLVAIVPAASPGKAGQPAEDLTWVPLSKVTARLRFPVVITDGTDAVAMFRAVQESVLRARHGDGPALLWCMLPGSGKGVGAVPPVERLRDYMSARSVRIPQAGR